MDEDNGLIDAPRAGAERLTGFDIAKIKNFDGGDSNPDLHEAVGASVEEYYHRDSGVPDGGNRRRLRLAGRSVFQQGHERVGIGY